VTAGGTVRSDSIQLAGDRVGPGTLGRTIAATTNQAFANARSAAEAHLHEYRATQQEFTEQLRRHDPDTARALAELTAATRGATAETQEAADTETRPRPWSPLG